jgi:hypothetical protein
VTAQTILYEKDLGDGEILDKDDIEPPGNGSIIEEVDTVLLFVAIVTALKVVAALDRNVAEAIAETILELSKPLPADSSEKRTPGSIRNETATLARGLLRSASLRTRAS